MADDATALPAEAGGGLRALAEQVRIGEGGMAPATLADVMTFARAMASSGPMVGKAFRGNVGACMGIALQAFQWKLSPFAVSQKAYVANDSIAYEAQLVMAVINAHAPVKERLKPRYEGEGAKRRCILAPTIKGESEPSIYESPEVGQITTKNSPLWKTDLDQQLYYYSARAWSRRYCPDILLGVYTPDELEPQSMSVRSSVAITDEADQRPPEEIAAESRAVLTGEQLDALYAKADEVGADLGRLCAYLEVPTVDDIEQREFARAMGVLDAKRKK